MRQRPQYPIEPIENDHIRITFNFETDNGIEGVSTPTAHFSRMAHSVSLIHGTDSTLASRFDTNEQVFEGTIDEFSEAIEALRTDEKEHAGIGVDKLLYDTRLAMNELLTEARTKTQTR